MYDPFEDEVSDLDRALDEGDRLYHFYKEEDLIWEYHEEK
jgi:hypothetical protein